MSDDGPIPPSPPNWGPPGGPIPPPPDPDGGYETEPLLPWQTPAAAPPPIPTSPHNPYVTAEDTFPTSSPYAQPVDPAAFAAEHEAAREEDPVPARTAGAHRVRRSPMRYVLPALLGAVVVVAIGIGLSGWISSGSPDQTGAVSSQVHVTTHSTASVATASSPAASASASTTPSTAPTTAKPTTKPSTRPSPTVTKPVAPPVVHAPVVVLNETSQRGMAARVAAHLSTLGWNVTGVGNWRGNISESTVYYPPGDLAAARSLAYDLGITRLRPRVAGMLTDRLTAVLTSDPLA